MELEELYQRIVTDIADTHTGTVADGYTRLLRGFESVAKQQLVNGTHLSIPAQLFEVSHEIPTVNNSRVRVRKHETTAFRNRVREFCVDAFGGRFDTDTQLIEFLVECDAETIYCEPSETKTQLADYYRDTRNMKQQLESETERGSLLVARLDGEINPISNMANELHEMFATWDQEPDTGMYGVMHLEMNRSASDKSGYDIVFQLAERQVTAAGVVTFRCKQIECPDAVKNRVNGHILLQDTPTITPQYESFCEFTNTHPRN